MFFRNLTLFRFPVAVASNFEGREHNDGAGFWIEEPAALEGLREATLQPVGPQELESRGFVSPYGRDNDSLLVRSGDAVWLTVGGEQRMLPGAAVNEALAKKIAEIETREGRRPGGRRRKQLRDDLVADMLPRAFVKPYRHDMLLDLGRGVCAVGTTSRRAAEGTVSEVRRALGSFPALPLNAEVAPRSVLTGWIAGEALPEGLHLGEECELRDPADHGARVRCTAQDLASDEIARHLEAGKQCTRLQLVLDDHVSFVLGDDLVIRKFRLLDGAVDQLEQTEADDIAAEVDARFALMAGEFARLFDVLDGALRFSTAEG